MVGGLGRDAVIRAAIVALLRGDQVLLLQRHAFDRAHPDPEGDGLWCFPGGKLDEGETAEVGAAREVREETQLIVEPREFLPARAGIARFWAEAPEDGVVLLSNEHRAYWWVTPSEGLQMRLAGPTTRDTLENLRHVMAARAPRDPRLVTGQPPR